MRVPPMTSAATAPDMAIRAVTPVAIEPHPDTAVKLPARSIVSRMKRRLSIARAWISGGSACLGRIGRTFGMSQH